MFTSKFSCTSPISYSFLNIHVAVVVLFSFIVLALAAHLTSVMDVFGINTTPILAALAIAVSVITILTITPLYASLSSLAPVSALTSSVWNFAQPHH
jgi:hypothetical protein